MSTDRELDALVAEHVFGATGRTVVYEWADRKQRARPVIAFLSVPKGAEFRLLDRDYGVCATEAGAKLPRGINLPKRYSSSIADAWLVVEQMAEKGMDFTLRCAGAAWCADFSLGGAASASPERAICLAALDALGVDAINVEVPS